MIYETFKLFFYFSKIYYNIPILNFQLEGSAIGQPLSSYQSCFTAHLFIVHNLLHIYFPIFEIKKIQKLK